MTDEQFEQFKVFLPKYLTPKDARELFSELEKFPQHDNFYLLDSPEEPLQGDGWKGLVAIDFHTLTKKAMSGIIISNSCDIDPKNRRALESKILFCPIIKLTSYAKLLQEAGRNNQQIIDIQSTIRTQKVTHLFYLPPDSEMMEESVAVLGDVHSHPSERFCKRTPIPAFYSKNARFLHLHS